jgi:hypothetical protein
MNSGDVKVKPETGPAQRKKPETDADRLLKKEFLLVYNAFSAFANAWDRMIRKPKFCRPITMGAEPKARREEKHLDRSIVAAETWQ